MDYARHHVELARKGPDGASQRATWELAAQRGNEDARRKLQGPEFPEHMAHIWEWTQELHGRSGMGMAGLAPLSYQTIQAWQALTGVHLSPLEVEALIAVDGAMLNARLGEEPGDTQKVATGPVTPAWPRKGPAHA